MPLVQELHFDLEHSHNMEIRQGRSIGTLVQNHEPNIDLRAVDDNEMGLGQGISHSYFLVPAIDQAMDLPHGQDGEYYNEYDQDSKHENKGDVVDHRALNGEIGESRISEDDSGGLHHDRQLALTSQGDELGFAEDNDLAVMENHDIDNNMDLIVHQNTEVGAISTPQSSGLQPQFVITSPIVQSRTVVPAPMQELTVGQEFPDVKSCRRALRDMAIALHFEIQTVKSDKTRFTAKCASEDARGGFMLLSFQQASVQWVASSVEERLKENPHCKPKEILEEIHRVHGITLSYKQAWRGKERFMASLRGSFEEDYRLLPQYCNQVRRTNPGSFDGDGALFPLAFGVVDEENDETWMWFLSELHNLLDTNTENMPRLTILSDRRKSIVDAVELNFPTAFHGFCMLHLSESFRKEFNNTLLVNLLWEAANALTVMEFEANFWR
ncbi:UNVERIFIED_CONTAM: hypothetical protein Sradi_0446600 [Sesamum radiatum]|uniref:MULE transposase domain-containing protein n=1 Tax=Sesamum radiatum TaxID=300843 RepID=A0AAW2WAY0_SESRA